MDLPPSATWTPTSIVWNMAFHACLTPASLRLLVQAVRCQVLLVFLGDERHVAGREDPSKIHKYYIYIYVPIGLQMALQTCEKQRQRMPLIYIMI